MLRGMHNPHTPFSPVPSLWLPALEGHHHRLTWGLLPVKLPQRKTIKPVPTYPFPSPHMPLTCAQWFLKTMRQVSGSAVTGLWKLAPRLALWPAARGFSLLSQLILSIWKGHTVDTGQGRETTGRSEVTGGGPLAFALHQVQWLLSRAAQVSQEGQSRNPEAPSCAPWGAGSRGVSSLRRRRRQQKVGGGDMGGSRKRQVSTRKHLQEAQLFNQILVSKGDGI